MITLYLATEKGYNVLNCLISFNKSHFIKCVVIGTDNNVIKDFSQEIKELCQYNNIFFFLNDLPDYIKTEYSLAISWRRLIKSNKSKLIVLHDSLLPKYRGFAPLVNQLVNGDKLIGVTALFASDQYDRGDIILQSTISIDYPIKINDAIKLISKCYEKIVLEIVETLLNSNSISCIKQKEIDATYSLWRDDEDYKIRWDQSSEKIKRFIDAVGFPYYGATSILNGEIIKILDADIIEDVKIINRDIGKIIFMNGHFPVVVCGEGLLLLKDIKDKEGNSLLPLKRFRLRFS
jgi:methionyl-tRNA formyltransferase